MTSVIITRPEPDASAFAKLCRARDLHPVLSPVMSVHIADEPVKLSGAGALAFTSSNGVRAFAANSEERGLPVFAVGKVTARAAREAGFKKIYMAGGDVGSLANHIVSRTDDHPSPVLHVSGSERAGDLVGMLEARGVPARRQVLYSAEPAEALSEAAETALKEADGDLWIAFFSPRTARLFVALAEQAGLDRRFPLTRLACLSAAVAKAAGEGWAGKKIASERNAKSLVHVMTEA